MSLDRSARLLAMLFASAGLVLLGGGAWIPAKAWLAQRLIARAWTQMPQGQPARRPWPWADTWPVARLILPEDGRALYVLAGASGESLAFGPGHVSASAPPGAPDNVVLAGHRDTHFAFLETLVSGDRLILETRRRRRLYRVQGAEVVHASRVELLAPTGRPQLTLITCFPFDAIVPGGPLRYVVHASGEPEHRSDQTEYTGG